ncbi:MAG: hypothetical protein WCI03_08645 [bacterium]|jgi:hypothetical protein
MAYGFYEKSLDGVELPHPPISLPIFRIVEKAFRVAWARMQAHPRPGFDLLHATEDIVTHELYEWLYDEVFNKDVVDGFDRQIFTVVAREAKLRNYDGAKLDKMPDIIIGLVGRSSFKPSQDWLFIECKPVDGNHSVGVHYCDKGIIRFVCGEYAWAMTSALMIGYARSGYTIQSKLKDALKLRPLLFTVDMPRPCRRSKNGRNGEAVYVSRHSRKFRYVETGKQAPDIAIRHLWLGRP